MVNTKLVRGYLAILLAFAMLLTGVPVAKAETVDLMISGSGIKSQVSIGPEDWSNFTEKEAVYSGNNSLNFHKIIKVKGYDLFELIGEDNLVAGTDWELTFICSDGFTFKKTVSELKGTYTYPNFTEGSKKTAQPMIARYSAVLGDYPKTSFAPPVSWSDRALNDGDIDKDFPKLVFGQTGIDDMNLSKWGKQVVKIIVGGETTSNLDLGSPYKHISYPGAPYNIDAISGATFTIEGPAVEGYRAISLRQIEENTKEQEVVEYYEKTGQTISLNTYEGINAGSLLESYIKLRPNAGSITFKNKSRQTILTVPITEASKYTVAYGINEVPYVYLDSDVGYRQDKFNDNGCFKLVYEQSKSSAKEFSNVAYIYVEEKDAKNIFEHTYAPYNASVYTDYEIIIHGDALGREKRYKVSEIEAMDDIKYTGEYSLSNSEYFWYYNNYKGVKLWDLLLKAGLDPKTPDETKIRFVAADNYNFAPMTIGEIKNYQLYGYYEKDSQDLGDGKFEGSKVEPIKSGMPPLVAYGFNGYPYVTRPTDAGFNPGLGNDGGPLRIIFGKTGYNDTNGSNQVQFLKEIIIGEGEAIGSLKPELSGTGEETSSSVDSSSTWNHNQGVYKEYLDQPVLRVTGSQVKEPMTFTLRQLESMLGYSLRDVYTGDGIREFEGIELWKLISEFVGLKDGVDQPSIRIFSGANYNQILRSHDQVKNGVVNSSGKLKKIMLAYAVEGYPLVPNEASSGYANNNAYGPIRLIIEESKSMWVKWVDCIVVGTGEYEEPKTEDVRKLDLPELPEPGTKNEKAIGWIIHRNDTGYEMSEASVRAMEYDNEGNLWIGTNGGGLSVRSKDGKWSHITDVETSNKGTLKIDTVYSIVQRENGELWMTLGGPNDPKGILVKDDTGWRNINKDNSTLPACFVQELELDGNGGIYIGTQNGLVHVDKDGKWTIYTQSEGLLPYSVDAVEPDGEGGVWIGYYPDTKGTDSEPKYYGGYQYLDPYGKLTTYDGFDPENFNLNWIRSISIDLDGGVWIVRSGNAPGYGQGEVDYLKGTDMKTFKSSELYPGLGEVNDIRLVVASPDEAGVIYAATVAGGVAKIELSSGETVASAYEAPFPTKQWNNVYFMDFVENKLMIGTNGGAAIYTELKQFADTTGHWAVESISKMAEMAYVKGDSKGFRPNDSITRAEFVVLLTRILGLVSKDSTLSFIDVANGSWYEESIAAAVENGLVTGYSDGSFRPSGRISRTEIAAILGRVLDIELSELQVNDTLSAFSDTIAPWAENSVAAAVRAGIIEGFPDGSFSGTQSATRAQTAVMLMRLLGHQ